MLRKSALWKANSIAFASSFCVMVMELIAARMLAPYIGVSLYTWTSIIGIIMAGIAAGNYVGGKIADRFASPITLMGIFFAGAVTVISISPLTQTVASADILTDWPLMIRFTVKVCGIFLLPSLVLSMVSPLVIKLSLGDLGQTGGTVGTIYAFSTAGSILGTFLTGFFLIDWYGTRNIIWIIAGVLILAGIVAWVLWRPPGKALLSRTNAGALAATILVISGSLVTYQYRNNWEPTYTKESNYYAINVLNMGGSNRILSLDHLLHSYVDLNDPKSLGYPYEQVFRDITSYLSKNDTAWAPRVLHLGGGGYSFPRYLETVYPASVNAVVEIDPAVTEVAYDYLGLRRDTSVRTYNLDARLFMMQRPAAQKYDVAIGDVFNDYSTPFHLTTLEFDRLVKDALEPDGIYILNVIDDYKAGTYMPSMIKTLREVFKNVNLIATGGDWSSMETATFVIVASDRPFDLSDFMVYTRAAAGKANVTSNPHDPAGLDKLLANRDCVLLTDDHVPTDIMVAKILK